MPTVAARVAVATTTPRTSCCPWTSCRALKPSTLYNRGIATKTAAYRQCKAVAASKPLSMSMSSQGSSRLLHACLPKEKKLSHLSAASTSFFWNEGIQRQSSSLKAYKSDFFRLPLPALVEKPEWWWRTLACVPYLIALQISDTGYYIHPFLEYYNYLGDMIYYVPGAITRLPAWFIMGYCYVAYIWIVKNKEWPHFLRFHLMMGMLMETALQVIWYSSNFFPLIHYEGRYGMYYWAGVGFAYISVILHCVRCALAGGFATIPVITDAALVHTLFNIGGFQRPF